MPPAGGTFVTTIEDLRRKVRVVYVGATGEETAGERYHRSNPCRQYAARTERHNKPNTTRAGNRTDGYHREDVDPRHHWTKFDGTEMRGSAERH